MSRTSTARRYAQAAFALALERDEQDLWLEDLQRSAGSLADDEVSSYLDSPLVPEADKLRLIRQLVPQDHGLVYNLIGLMVMEGIVSLLPLVAQEFQRLVDEQQGIRRAAVTSAVAVPQAVMEAIRQRLQEITGKQIIVTAQVKPSILGGFVAQVGDRLIDGSTRTRLRTLRGRMISGES
jgi:F-type H+-transporting ATPase subunit delta